MSFEALQELIAYFPSGSASSVQCLGGAATVVLMTELMDALLDQLTSHLQVTARAVACM
jgi:hypothetical protein